MEGLSPVEAGRGTAVRLSIREGDLLANDRICWLALSNGRALLVWYVVLDTWNGIPLGTVPSDDLVRWSPRGENSRAFSLETNVVQGSLKIVRGDP